MEFDEVSFTHDLECKYQQNTMVHGFWALGFWNYRNEKAGEWSRQITHELLVKFHWPPI